MAAPDPIPFSVGSVFNGQHYRIPLYQRNYAWEVAQTTQLIRDVWDFRKKSQNYYIGTLVVYKHSKATGDIYETIDGQQRLTTLHLLLSVLKHEFGIDPDAHYTRSLDFESRPLSTDTLPVLAKLGLVFGDREIDGKMQQAYLDMARELSTLTKNSPVELKNFANYLSKRVLLLRVEVPEDTDLNHYFEVMNNRGDQLEKHEILKAQLLNELIGDLDSSKTFTAIWDACSEMDRYMVMAFPRKLRDNLFARQKKTWDRLPENFNEVKATIKAFYGHDKPGKKTTTTLLDIVYGKRTRVTPEQTITEPIARFTSTVTFPNFLLHVLRVMMSDYDVRLDDKQLIPEFRKALKRYGRPSAFVRKFGYELLRMRLMFDTYVIKREITDKKDGWSLQMMHLSGDDKFYYAGTFGNNIIHQERITMLLAMFHVSFPQPIYKHWLSGILRYFYQHDHSRIAAPDYIRSLEKMSKAFYFDRFGKKELKYYDIIYTYDCEAQQSEIKPAFLNSGTNVQNFIFNRLDYLIWCTVKIDDEKKFNIPDINNFEFTFRSSVEHFFPQSPHDGIERWPSELLDCFGNLCLISSHRNSSLSNNLPRAKEEHYREIGSIESLKQKLMLAKYLHWNEDAVLAHQADMVELLQNG